LPGATDSEETDTARYHALGNAVTPPVIEWLANRLRMRLEERDADAPPAEAIAV
jgi:DNA (cytosine-5)-methyltransferase 1